MQYRIGIDLGGTAIKGGIIDENYQIIRKSSLPTSGSFASICADIASLAKSLAASEELAFESITSVGVGSPGCVNQKTGRVMKSGNLQWYDVPFLEELRKHLSVPVSIGNDANCAAIGEALAGSGKGHGNMILITLGTGIGGGILLDGKLFSGGDSMGTELGHIPLLLGEEPCSCGLRGCFEAYASVTALIRMTRNAMKNHPESAMNNWVKAHDGHVNGRTAFDCAKAMDPAALEITDRYETYVAAGIGGLINIFRPDIVLIGGGISAEGEYLLKPIREKLPSYVFASDFIGTPEIRAASLGNTAGIIGAAFLDCM